MGLLHNVRWGPLVEMWLDGELTVGRVDAVLDHLADCPDCGAEIQVLALIKASLSRLQAV